MMNHAIKKAIENHQKGMIEIAKKQYSNIILDNADDDGVASHYLAAIYQSEGDYSKAKELYEASLKKTKDIKVRAMFLTNYGALLRKIGAVNEALASYQEAYRINPKIAELNTNIATLLWANGDREKALKYARDSLSIKETCEAHLVLARDFKTKRNYSEAESHAIKACDLKPNNIEALCLLAGIYTDINDFVRARKCFEQAKKLTSPDRFDFTFDTYYYAYISSAKNVSEIKDYVKNKAKYIDKLTISIIGMIIADLKKYLVWNSYDHYLKYFIDKFSHEPRGLLGVGNVLYSLSMNLPVGMQKKIAENIAKERYSSIKKKIHTKKITGKPKVGLLSSDFRSHAVGYLCASLFEKFNTNDFDYIVYSNHPETESNERTRIRNAFGRWKNIYSLTDEEAFELIQSDEIDVIIEFNGCTTGERLSLLAKKPAPIQITYLGMPGSTGCDFIDYVIGDKYVLSEECRREFSEKPLILNCCYQPNDQKITPKIEVTRKQFNLPDEKIVICSFNQTYKLDKETFDNWLSILEECNNAVLWMIIDSEEARSNLIEYCNLRNFDVNKIIFSERVDHDLHINRLALADFSIDSFPYNAHTTASDCLRAGIPIVTMRGKTFAGRVTESLLAELDLIDELVADDYKSFRSIGVKLAKSKAYLDEIKLKIATRFHKSRLVDNTLLAENIENLILVTINEHNKQIDNMSNNLDSGLSQEFDLDRSDSFRKSNCAASVSDYFTDQNFNIQVRDEKTATTGIQLKTNSVAGLNATDSEMKFHSNDNINNLPNWLNKLESGGNSSRSNNVLILKDYILKIRDIPRVVDVGAYAINNEVEYEFLLDIGAAAVLGFEPDPNAFMKLSAANNRKFFQTALGDGSIHYLNVCYELGMSSILQPDQRWLALFPDFAKRETIERKIPVSTERLNDIREAKSSRFLKLDVQGAEMMILENAEHLLDDLALIQLKASPTPLYHGEASFFELGLWLQQRGFVLYTLSDTDRRKLIPHGSDKNPYSGRHHIFQVDAVFMPNPLNWVELSTERLEALAFLMHAIYRSYDVAILAMDVLDKRDKGSRVELYRLYLEHAGPTA